MLFLLCYRKIEVLRDGASAQYGSDAGCNQLKCEENTNKLEVALLREVIFQGAKRPCWRK
jgi:hypothetical protein